MSWDVPARVLGKGAYDIVICGSGVIGSSIAHFLGASKSYGRALVIERDPTFTRASSALSASSIRQQFSTRENVEIGLFGASFLKRMGDELEVDGHKPNAQFVEGGYLFLATEPGLPTLRENHALQRAVGADTVMLRPTEIKSRFPWINVDGIAGGCLGVKNEGWFDPHTVHQALRSKAKSNGVDFVQGEVTSLERKGNRIVSVGLASGERIPCGKFVNAAGAWGGKVASMAGVDLPVRPRKRIIYVFNCHTPIVPRSPLLVDVSGAWMRPEGKGFICGICPPAEQDPDCDDLDVTDHLFDDVIWPALAERVPAFEAIKRTAAWAGFYDYNTVDQNGIIGPHPDVANMFFCNGFSGHGLQQAPAAGRALAELLLHDRFVTLDLSRFAYTRFASGELIIEKNVV